MPQPITNIHDKFIKQILSDKEAAIAFLRELLPKKIADFLELPSLNYVNTSYLSKARQRKTTDRIRAFPQHIKRKSHEHLR